MCVCACMHVYVCVIVYGHSPLFVVRSPHTKTNDSKSFITACALFLVYGTCTVVFIARALLYLQAIKSQCYI